MKYEIENCNYIHDKDEYRLEAFYLKVIPNRYTSGSYCMSIHRIMGDTDFEFYLPYSNPYAIECLKKFFKKINVNYYLYKLNVRINKENLDKLTFFCKIYGV